MTETMRLAVPRIIAILLMQAGIIAIGLGYFEAVRGQSALPDIIPYCEAGCKEMPEELTRAVLDATVGSRRGLEALGAGENMCELPRRFLETADPSADWSGFIQAMEVEGIAAIERTPDGWRANPGRNTSGASAALRKLWSPLDVHKSCFAPTSVWSGPFGFMLIALGAFILLISIGGARRA